MVAIVLVGGKHHPLHDPLGLPPGLIQIAGEPIISWITNWLKQQGFRHIVFSAGFGAEKITAWANQRSSQESDLFLDVVAEPRPLGTAGAAANCMRRYPSSNVLVINGDALLLANLKPYFKKIQNEQEIDGIIMGARIANAGRFGTLECDKDNRLIGFHEKQSGSDWVNAGVYLLKSHLLENISSDKEVSLEYDCFPTWLQEGKTIYAEKSSVPFIDMGTPEALKGAKRQILDYQAQLNDIIELA